MRIANLNGRLAVLTPNGSVDVEKASDGRFSSDPAAVYEHWDEFQEWFANSNAAAGGDPWDEEGLGAPSPRPRQVFAVGLNYVPHVDETGFVVPESPVVFTKFASCLTGPFDEVPLPSGNVDWEVELVVVLSRAAHQVPAEQAWDHIAGVTVGQDYSERVVQSAGSVPQFSVGKSFPGFGPTGPWLVTPDEFPDRDDIEVRCDINGEQVQLGRTSDLIFSVPYLVEWLSARCQLFPGDLIFTGTPAGVGSGRKPPRFLQSGDVVVSTIEGVGQMRNHCVTGVQI